MSKSNDVFGSTRERGTNGSLSEMAVNLASGGNGASVDIARFLDQNDGLREIALGSDCGTGSLPLLLDSGEPKPRKPDVPRDSPRVRRLRSGWTVSGGRAVFNLWELFTLRRRGRRCCAGGGVPGGTGTEEGNVGDGKT